MRPTNWINVYDKSMWFIQVGGIVGHSDLGQEDLG